MKKLFFTLCLLFSTLFFCACQSSEDPSEISVNPVTISADVAGSVYNVNLSSNTEWSASSTVNWIQVSPAMGEGTQVISVKVVENKGFDSRSGVISFVTSDGAAQASVSVQQDGVSPLLSVNTSQLNMAEGANDKKTFNITSNCEWSISNCPDWLSISATKGSNNATIEVTTVSFNNSPQPRSAKLSVKNHVNSATSEITVTQAAGLVANCNVQFTNLLAMSDAFVFDFSYGSAVSYFYTGDIEASEEGRYTDDEIIELLDTYFERYTPNDGYVISFPGLDETTDYIIYTVAFDKNGKRGELISKKVKTGTSYNEPYVNISDVEVYSDRWEWATTPSGYTYQYYQVTWVGTENSIPYYNNNDAIVAWFVHRAIKADTNGTTFSPIERATSWYRGRSSSDTHFQIVTWGTKRDGSFSYVINRERYYITSGAVNGSVASKNGVRVEVAYKSDFEFLKGAEVKKIN